MGIEETAKKYNSNDLEAEFEILDDFARFDQNFKPCKNKKIINRE